MPRSVLATADAVVTLASGSTRVIKKNTGYLADDDVVREFPWAFDLGDEDRRSRRGRRVEQATAAPGELRDL